MASSAPPQVKTGYPSRKRSEARMFKFTTQLCQSGCVTLGNLLNLSETASLLKNTDNKIQITLFQRFVVWIK